MALLKAVNDNFARDIEIRLATYNSRRGAAIAQKSALKKSLKAELIRPGTLTAAFTLGMLIMPKKKSATGRNNDSEIQRYREQLAAARRQQQQEGDAKDSDKDKDGFSFSSMLTSVITTTLVRLLTQWLTANNPLSSVKSDAPDQESVGLRGS